ncbi:MAG TPA: hypothetical protein VFQ63_01640 [Patescibacteria group bacterium]|nr:hypothetical protein [Patescibacteria group bacterium]
MAEKVTIRSGGQFCPFIEIDTTKIPPALCRARGLTIGVDRGDLVRPVGCPMIDKTTGSCRVKKGETVRRTDTISSAMES